MNTYTHVHRLSFHLAFPCGVAFGEGRTKNELSLARDGQGRPVVRGSALTGVLRAAWRNHLDVSNDDPAVTRFFGIPAGDDEHEVVADSRGQVAGCADSPLEVADSLLQLGDARPLWRTHHLRCRHLGRVVDGGLFRIESAPPGSRAPVTLWLKGTGAPEETEFLRKLAALLSRGIVFGGNGNRGIGLGQIDGDVCLRTYDLLHDGDAGDFEDDHWTWRRSPDLEFDDPNGKARVVTEKENADRRLRIDLQLEIPRGQDLLVGDGQGIECEIEPQRVRAADGNDYWRLPGATLRGALGDWIRRLAARAGRQVADNYRQYVKDTQEGRKRDGKWIGSLCMEPPADEKEDRLSDLLEDLDETHPVEHLFGSLVRSGRIHISDGLVPVSRPDRSSLTLAADDDSEVQRRMHVAVNPLTGGAVEHMLFDNLVLTAPCRFPVTILVDSPTEREIEWLAEALGALHHGTIRIGSSKSAGRLRLAEPPAASGPLAEEFLVCLPELAGVDPPDLLDDLKNAFPQAGTATGSSDGQTTPTRSEYLVGTLQVSFSKQKKKIIKLSFQRENKPKPVVIDYTSIPETSRGFDPADAEDGDPIHIFQDAQNKIRKVVIPGKREVVRRTSRVPGNRDGKPVAVRKLPKGSPKLLGEPFHNPYTFLPFQAGASKRTPVTPRTIDELLPDENDRFTGVIRLKLKTLAPLLTSQGMHEAEKQRMRRDAAEEHDDGGHKTYHALAIGNDVIVPATGVRGFLRNLMTVITGGPPAFLEPHMYLCQGRDAQLGPSKQGDGPRKVFLAEVVRPGSYDRPGTVRLGETRLIEAEKLEEAVRRHGLGSLERLRKSGHLPNSRLWVGLDDGGNIAAAGPSRSASCPWAVKLSGRPVNTRGVKKEGLFLSDGATIELPSEYWAAYMSRHQHGVCSELKRGHLVWLEPAHAEQTEIRTADDIRSIQWARWGRRGERLLDKVPRPLHPDYMQDGDQVSMVTNLFGQVSPDPDRREVPQFKGRIAPDNLVFHDAKRRLVGPRQLAVLSSPHPGCLPFYRQGADPDGIDLSKPYAGYKIYRTSQHSAIHDEQAPWKYENQGVYDDRGLLKKERQTVCFSAQLLPEGVEGTLHLSVRSLSREELALLLLACRSSWRLGGGKPFGLGHCQVVSVSVLDEQGRPVELPLEELRSQLPARVVARAGMWEAAQRPVERLRYPRAVIRNKNKNSRAGLSWFQKCASPQKGDQGGRPALEPIYVCGDLQEQVRSEGVDNSALGEGELIRAQVLKPVDPSDPEADLLFGYDVLFVDTADDGALRESARRTIRFNRNKQQAYPRIAPFDPERHVTGSESAGENISQSRRTRQEKKQSR